jgi:hypothetical protein
MEWLYASGQMEPPILESGKIVRRRDKVRYSFLMARFIRVSLNRTNLMETVKRSSQMEALT